MSKWSQTTKSWLSEILSQHAAPSDGKATPKPTCEEKSSLTLSSIVKSWSTATSSSSGSSVTGTSKRPLEAGTTTISDGATGAKLTRLTASSTSATTCARAVPSFFTADTTAGSSTDGQKKAPWSAFAKTPYKLLPSGSSWYKPTSTPKIVSTLQFPPDDLSFERNGVTYFREFLWFQSLPGNKVKVTLGTEEQVMTATMANQLLDSYLTSPIESLKFHGFALKFLKVSTEIEVVDICSKKATPHLLQVLQTRPFDQLIKEIYF